ncbi:MAG: PhzF family phenazine biosynthesis protein, partial [Acidimicrobiales bacterium]
MRHAIVVVESEGLVAGLTPDLGQLASIVGPMGASCVAGSGDTWKTSMFAPGAGVPEDPATGSAAGPLAVHLARQGQIGWGEEITISPGVEIGRPSTLYAVARGSDDGVESVEVGGQAVIVGRGEFSVPRPRGRGPGQGERTCILSAKRRPCAHPFGSASTHVHPVGETPTPRPPVQERVDARASGRRNADPAPTRSGARRRTCI